MQDVRHRLNDVSCRLNNFSSLLNDMRCPSGRSSRRARPLSAAKRTRVCALGPVLLGSLGSGRQLHPARHCSTLLDIACLMLCYGAYAGWRERYFVLKKGDDFMHYFEVRLIPMQSDGTSLAASSVLLVLLIASLARPLFHFDRIMRHTKPDIKRRAVSAWQEAKVI